MHHIRTFLNSKPWKEASVTVSPFGRLLAEAKADAQTPVATVIAKTGNKQLQAQFAKYIETVYACNCERFSGADATRGWNAFQAAVTFEQLFTNQLWQACPASTVHALHWPLLGLESPLAASAASAGDTAAAVPSSAAFLALRILERSQEAALAEYERLWAAETLRPELKVAVAALSAAEQTLAATALPYPLESMAPKKGCSDLAAAMLERLQQYQRSAEELKDAADELSRFVRQCTAHVDRIRTKYAQQQQKQQVDSAVVQAAVSSLQVFAYTTTIKAMQTALGVVDSVKVPARLTNGKLIEKLRDNLSGAVTRLAAQRVAEIEPADTETVHKLRHDAYKAAAHLDVAVLLEQVASMCEQYAEANRDKGISAQDAREYIHALLLETRITERKQCDALVALETAAVNDRALPAAEHSLVACVAALAEWKSNITDLPGAVAPASAAAAAVWYESWMDVPVPVELVHSLEKDLAPSVAEARALRTNTALAPYGVDTPLALVSKSSSSSTVALSVVLTRLRPWVSAFAVAEVLYQNRPRKRR